MPEWMHKGYQAWHREWNKFLSDLMKNAPDMPPEDAAGWLKGIVDAERARLADCAARGVLPAAP